MSKLPLKPGDPWPLHTAVTQSLTDWDLGAQSLDALKSPSELLEEVGSWHFSVEACPFLPVLGVPFK